jgi:hypothetical protein
VLNNQATGTSAKANLYLGPFYNGLFTHWINSIDYSNGVVILEDGSTWVMSSWDKKSWKKWLPNDTVLIGVNDGFLSSFNPNILLNVNVLNHAIGECVNP